MNTTTQDTRYQGAEANGQSPKPISPLVLCLTNTVAANFTANVLLAIGAKPAMVEEPSEAAELAAAADAVLVNVGTLTTAQTKTMRAAVRVCQTLHKPWVLDPVAVHLLAFRRQFIAELLTCQPTLIRGNIAEIDYLYRNFEVFLGSVPTLATGSVDRICPGGQALVTGGVPMLQAVTATGCAQGAVCAAMLGRGLSPCEAAEAASRLMKRAGERAWESAKRPGSFQAALLDALWELTHDAN